jgi:outer membrane receptor protein involved in Fe transport
MRILLICLLLIYLDVNAQQPASTSGMVLGKVFDGRTKQPVPDASVAIKDSAQKVIMLVITDGKGKFQMENVPIGSYTAEITYVGYQAISKNISITSTTPRLNLGTLFFNDDTARLGEVIVTAEKSEVSLKMDKKVYTVGKDILAQSGSVNDILNNIPAVAVDPGGIVRLRGNSNVNVLINGRRSGLTLSNALEQIPSENVEKIEVITTPSSRYEAAGSAGIINIVLKKNKKAGFSGQLRLVTGTPNDYQAHASLNYKSNKLNLFTNIGGRYTDYVGLYTTKQVTTDNVTVHLNSRTDEKRHDDGQLIYIGGDYFINKKNTFTAAFFKNATQDKDETTITYNYGEEGHFDSTLVRRGNSKENRSYNQVESNYTRTFDKEGKKFTIDMQYDFWNSDKKWNLSTQKIFPDEVDKFPIRTTSIGSSKDLALQSDFVNPLNDKSTIEFGVKLESRSVTSKFTAEELDGNGWKIFSNINNEMEYKEKIGGVYSQFTNTIKKFTYLAGLRWEFTRIDIEDLKGSFNNQKEYNRLFPTVNLSYAFGKQTTGQLNYSKRINRPSLNSLYPFNELTDFNSQFVGNPDLNPAFTDAFELGLLQRWNKFSLHPSIYSHFTTDVIRYYAYRNDDRVFITTPFNLNRENRYGFEVSATYDPLKWLQFNAQYNFYGFKQVGGFKGQDLGITSNTWSTRLNTRLKLPYKLSVQVRTNIAGAESDAQSRTKSYYSIDFGINKILLKDKATIVIDGSNIFNTRTISYRIIGTNYVLDQTSNFNAARFRFSFIYRLNKKDGQAARSQRGSNRD